MVMKTKGADGYENKGVAKKATQKILKTKA
jgi:hypothetical protein